jgi:uncharacterized protein (TIRG00374 family)
LLYFALAALVVVSHAWRWRMVAVALGGEAPLWRFVAARLAGDAVGTAVPSARVGGDPVRVALLYGGGASGRGREAFAGVSVDRVLETIGNTICTLVYVFAFVHSGPPAAGRGTIWIAGVMLLALAAFAAHLTAIARAHAPFRRLFGTAEEQRAGLAGRLRGLLVRIEEQLAEILRAHRQRFLAGIAAALLTQGLVVLMYVQLLDAFGIALPLPVLLMAFVASGFARAAPTPGGLGALEAAQVGVLSLSGSSAELGFVVGIVMRLHDTIWSVIGAGVLLLRGAKWRS